MLSSDLALLQHMPGHHLTQEKDRLRVHADAAIKTLARTLQEIATLSNTDPGIVNDTKTASRQQPCMAAYVLCPHESTQSAPISQFVMVFFPSDDFAPRRRRLSVLCGSRALGPDHPFRLTGRRQERQRSWVRTGNG